MMDPRVVVYHAPLVTSTAAEIDNTLMTREVPVQIGDRSCAPRLQAIRGRHRCFPSASQHRAGLLLLVLVLLSVVAIVPPALPRYVLRLGPVRARPCQQVSTAPAANSLSLGSFLERRPQASTLWSLDPAGTGRRRKQHQNFKSCDLMKWTRPNSAIFSVGAQKMLEC